MASIGWSSGQGRKPDFRSKSMRTCSAMPQAISWQAMATTPVQSRIILGIATSNTPSATPNFRPRAPRISGAIRSCLGKTNAADAGTPIEAEPVSAKNSKSLRSLSILRIRFGIYPQTYPQIDPVLQGSSNTFGHRRRDVPEHLFGSGHSLVRGGPMPLPCLLYTSDAADDLLCVDLGGRRIIKKKKKH